MREDVHFYIDNAPPVEVAMVLRCLSSEDHMSVEEIAGRLTAAYSFSMQRDRTYSPRRLYDLGLACQSKQGNRVAYSLSPTGERVQALLSVIPDFCADVMHYLHYTTYDSSNPASRKYLWSYRVCCNTLWQERRIVPTGEMAARIQTSMEHEFPELDLGARQGARFDRTAASRVYTWIRQLVPSPILKDDDPLVPRIIQRFELVLLALDHLYRERGYRYGDPVILDELLLNEISGVFFLDAGCCQELILLAGRLVGDLKLTDTFAGTSVSLLAPYGIDRI